MPRRGPGVVTPWGMGANGVNHRWTKALDALLGTMPDHKVAQRIGVTPLSVFKRRKKLGIRAVNRAKPPPPLAKASARKPRSRIKRPRARSLEVPLSQLLNGRRIRDLSADEYLAVARLIRFGR